jgi:phosphodiesterase/alkaline phosphatase D-like protein
MKARTSMIVVLSALFLFASLGFAQGTAVQITKGPVVEHTDANSAVIAWSTNVSSSSVVKYGTDQGNLSQTAQMPWGGLTHRVTVKNLEAGKTYYFQVVSGQAQGTSTTATSNVSQFNTKGGNESASNSGSGNNVFKIVNGPVIEKAGDTNAIIAWTTDRPASSVVKYGTDPNNLGQTAQEPWGATTHRVEIKNLQPGTKYYYSVHSAQGKNAPGQAADTPPQPFTTTGGSQASNNGQGGSQLSITNGPVVEHVADTNATVAWSTNLPASTIVKYGTDQNNLNQTAQEAWGQTTHRVQLKNLQPNTQYYFSVHSAQGRNAPGQRAEKGPIPFKTAAPGQQASK